MFGLFYTHDDKLSMISESLDELKAAAKHSGYLMYIVPVKTVSTYVPDWSGMPKNKFGYPTEYRPTFQNGISVKFGDINVSK